MEKRSPNSQALTRMMRDRHRRWLAWPLAHIDVWDEQIDGLRVEITRGLGALEAAGPPPSDPIGTTGGRARAGNREAPGPPAFCPGRRTAGYHPRAAGGRAGPRDAAL
jgi:hypothetical protein